MDNAQKPARTIQSALISSPRESARRANAHTPSAEMTTQSSFFQKLISFRIISHAHGAVATALWAVHCALLSNKLNAPQEHDYNIQSLVEIVALRHKL